jgi:MoaA/NifB/PqqE/SkfB family radical SAM enzyme
MPMHIYRKIRDQLFPYLKWVCLSQAGEPLLTPYLDEIVQDLKRYSIRLEIITNGMLLDRNGVLERLMNVMGILTVSFDAVSKKLFESIRVGADYDRIIRNISTFNQLRMRINSGTRPLLSFNFVMMNENIEELPEFIKMASNLGADYVTANHIVVFHSRLKESSLIFNAGRYNKYIHKAAEVAKRLKMKFNFPPPIPEKNRKGDEEQTQKDKVLENPARCYFIWERTFFDVNGDVWPCCIAFVPVVGNIKEESFKHIWVGSRYRKFRKGIIEKKPVRCCKNCYLVNAKRTHREFEDVYLRDSLYTQ